MNEPTGSQRCVISTKNDKTMDGFAIDNNSLSLSLSLDIHRYTYIFILYLCFYTY